jgi:hypothetical protein
MEVDHEKVETPKPLIGRLIFRDCIAAKADVIGSGFVRLVAPLAHKVSN